MNNIQEFDEKTINRSIEKFKNSKYSRGCDGVDNRILYTNSFCDNARKIILEGYYKQNYNFSKIRKINCSRRTICVYNIVDRIMLDIVSQKVQSVFSPLLISRDNIIRALISLLNQDCNMTVVKIDIKEYFPSIDHIVLIKKLTRTNLLSPQLVTVIKNFLSSYSADGKGLPQGIELSSLLAEIYLEDFDKKLRLLDESILLSYRYVDDIILVLKGKHNSTELKDKITDLLNEYALNINNKKYVFRNIQEKKQDRRDVLPSTDEEFEYLGYSFKYYYHVLDGKQVREFKIGIAKNKLAKMLYKINKIFKDYKSNKNYYLLRERLMAFTNTYKVKFNDDSIIIGYAEAYKLINNYNALKKINKTFTSNLEDIKSTLTIRRYNELKGIIDFRKKFFKQRKNPMVFTMNLSTLKKRLRTLYRHEFTSDKYLETFIKNNSDYKQRLWSLYYRIVNIKVY